MALTAAIFTCGGVGKSGSPAVRLATSTPDSLIFRASWVNASVADSSSCRTFNESDFTVLHPSRLHLFGEALPDIRGDELTDISVEQREFPDDARVQVGVFLVGHQENGRDFAVKFSVRQRHLKLILKVRDRAQPADNCARLLRPCVPHKKAVKAVHGNILVFFHDLPDHGDTLGRAEQRPFARAACNSDNYPVKYLSRPVDDVDMAVRDGVKRPRIDGDSHGIIIPASSRFEEDGTKKPS